MGLGAGAVRPGGAGGGRAVQGLVRHLAPSHRRDPPPRARCCRPWVTVLALRVAPQRPSAGAGLAQRPHAQGRRGHRAAGVAGWVTPWLGQPCKLAVGKLLDFALPPFPPL